MPQKSKTPAGTGASRDSFAGLSLPLSTALAIQAQFLIAVNHFRLKLPAMVAPFAEGGGVYHG